MTEAVFEGGTGQLLQAVQHRSRVDPSFAQLWGRYVGALNGRGVLDPRTRHLLLTGQCTVTRSVEHLGSVLRDALQDAVPVREILEVILQCIVYTGDHTVRVALDTFDAVCRDLGVEVERTSMGRTDQPRSLESERDLWASSDRDDARLAGLVERYGWEDVSAALLSRPGLVDAISYLDALDSDFCRHWLAFTYGGMYRRRVLDEKTRLLCVVGNFVALGSPAPTEPHMRLALTGGCTPRELVEVCFFSSIMFGMPNMTHGLRLLIGILESERRLDEVNNAVPPWSA